MAMYYKNFLPVLASLLIFFYLLEELGYEIKINSIQKCNL